MLGPGALQLTLTSPSIVQSFNSQVVMRGFGAAYEGLLTLPVEFHDKARSGPFEDAGLPPSAIRAPGARALLVAIGQAIQHPATDRLPEPSRRAIVVGSQTAAIRETVDFLAQVDEVGANLVNPGLFPSTVMNAASGLAAIHHQCEGPNITLNNGALSALDAIALGADLIVSRQADLVLAGGFEGLDAHTARLMGRPAEALSIAVIVALGHVDDESSGSGLGQIKAFCKTDLSTRIEDPLEQALEATHEDPEGLAEPLQLTADGRHHESTLVELLRACIESERETSPLVTVSAHAEQDLLAASLVLAPLSRSRQ